MNESVQFDGRTSIYDIFVAKFYLNKRTNNKQQLFDWVYSHCLRYKKMFAKFNQLFASPQ